MRLFLALVLAAATATPVLADTIVPGGNVINQTWTPASSPYVIQGDITVPAGSTLTIEPGTTVRFAASDAQGAGEDLSRVELVVAGRLTVAGTAAQPVQMIGESANAGSWYGIVVSGDAAELQLANLQIASPTVGILHLASTASVTTSAVTMSSVGTVGVRVEAGAPTYHGIATAGGTYGFELRSAGSATFTSCSARGTSSSGARFSPTTAGRSLSLINCTLDDNGSYGVYSNGSAGTVTIRDSIITNSFYGIARSDSSTYSITYSNIWGHNTSFTGGATAGTGCIEANPLYVSTTNLRLTSNSPSRFGAMGGGDMGALPYTTDATPGWYGVLWSPVTFTAGTPYAIEGDLGVGPGVTVTIQPGAVLSFEASDIMQSGEDTVRAELIVRGSLVANGEAAQPIQLVGASANAGSWYGIVVAPTAGPGALALSHATITSPTVGILHLSPTATVSTSAVTLNSVGTAGIRVEAGAPTYDGIATSGGTYGFEVRSAGSATLTNCAARATSSSGARFSATTAGRALSLVNCTLEDNGSYGVYSNGSAGTVTIKNSIITNSFYGVARSDSSTYSITYSNIWGHNTNFTGGATPGTGCISQNPQYVSTTDLQLQGSSVCIDAGTATGAPTRDQRGVTRPLDGDGINGVGYDLGAFEYVLTPVCGNGAVEPGETCDSGAQNGQYGACNATCTGLGPRCGDGTMNGAETCDDGNASDTDACLTTCVTATCGDGFVRAGVEQCDDNNTSDTDGCVGATCQLATCGDGFVRAGMEQCDDGNTSNNDACLADCTPASCGDGYTDSTSEECDDGNTVETDACLMSCAAASCGDGVVRADVEECDDSNTTATDGCTATCQIAVCGDGITQAGAEECDDGNASDDDACTTQCTVIEGGQPMNPDDPSGEETGGGCCSTGSSTGGLPALIALVGLALGRRRKRSR